MLTKPATLFLLFSTIALPASAQDIILLRNHTTIKAKVQLVDKKTIVYKKYNDPDGSDHTVNRRIVSRIEYENGMTDVMTRGGQRTIQPKPATPEIANQRNNIISFSPALANETGVGVSLAYERLLGKNGNFAICLPVTALYNGYGRPHSSTEPFQSINRANRYQRIYGIEPGVKYYLEGARGNINPAIGLSLLYRQGFFNIGGTYFSGKYEIRAPKDKVYMQQTGMMASFSANFCPARHFYFGIDLGFGITFSNMKQYQNTTIQQQVPNRFLLQLALRPGFRF